MRGFWRIKGACPYPDYHLCVSHACRKRLNEKRNMEQRQGKESFFSEAPKSLEHQQSFWLFKGQQVFGGTTEGGVRNGFFYTVEAVDAETVQLRCGETTVSLKTPTAARVIRPAHALTYKSCQGLTLQGRISLDEWWHQHFTHRDLYVGLSRATSYHLVGFAQPPRWWLDLNYK